MTRRLALAALSVSAVACAPSAKPVGFEVDHMDWETVDAHVDVRAVNPWPIDLTVRSVHYDVRVGDRVVATGTVDQPHTVPAGGKKKVALPLTVDTRATLNALTGEEAAATGTATTDAIVSGEVTFDTPFGPLPIPIEYGHAVPVLSEPSVRAPVVEIKQASLRKGTMDLVVGFTVSNPNPIDLTTKQVDYGVSFAGESLVSGDRDAVTLAADGPTKLRFPVRIDVGALGRGAVRAFERGRISGEVWLSGRVKTPWQSIPLDLRRSGAMQVW